jgi:hypothetical protein
MDEADIRNAAKFLIDRHGVAEAKQRAAQRALDVADPSDRASWLRILQAIIDFKPSAGADTPLN